MDISFPRTEVAILPSAPVELLVLADGKAIRVAIDWATIRRCTDADPLDADAVRNFMHDNRKRIELAIEAHLFAHGVPLDRQLVLTEEDLARALA